VLAVMERDGLPARAVAAGGRLRSQLEALPAVTAVRGRGLLLAAELEPGHDAGLVQAELLRRGLVTNAVTPTAIRLAPPLTVTDVEIDEAVTLIRGVLA